MIDAHAHLERAAGHPLGWRAAGVEGVVGAGVHPERLAEQCAVARVARGAGLSAGVTVGLHPWEVRPDPGHLERALDALQRVLAAPPPELVGVGEIGLDHLRARSAEDRATQARAFADQLAVAAAGALPVVLHVVRAHAAAGAIVRAVGPVAGGLQVHGFAGSAEVAREWLALGAYLSFGGTVTRPLSARRRAGIRAVPDHRLLVETDAPDQAVAAARAAGRPGSPADLPQVVAALARVRGQDPAHVARVSAANARTLFRLDRASEPLT